MADADALVIDGSIGIGMILGEPSAPEITRRISEHTRDGGALLVPFLFWQEVTTVLARRYRYAGGAVLEAIYDLEQLGVETRDLGRAELLLTVDLMDRHALSGYDATYLMLAIVTDARLLTADRALAAAAADRGILVGGSGGTAEAGAVYEREPSWPAWPGAAAYLGELRERARLADA